LDNDVLYVLDPKNNAVWRYEGNNGSFDQMPSLFFDQQVPKQLTTVIDLATAQDELYLLHNTGEMVHCTYSHIKEVKLTECEDPAMFSDRRQNTATQQRTFAEATFTQTLTSPGNNTLLVLDNKNKSIYRFSLKLNLDKVMTLRMSDGSTLTSKDISAIGVGPGNLLIVAIGQEIYSSSLP
jgi:sugar lactone lactonase YvrE